MWLVRERERAEELRRQNEAQGITEQEDEQLVQEEEEYKISIWTKLYYNQIIRGLIILLAVAIIIPVFIVLFLDTTNPDFDAIHTCSIETGYQISCGVQNTTFEKCAKLKCCFNETDYGCFHKVSSYYQYTLEGSDVDFYQPMENRTPFGGKNVPVYMYVKKQSSFKISITLSTAKEDKTDKQTFDNEEYEVQVFKNVMAVEINRTKSTTKLLSTTRGPVIISDKYWEWTVDLFAEHLFGMDFLRMPDNENITKVIYKNSMDHTSTARFTSYSSGKFHGLEVVHSGPLEVTITEAKLLVLRSFSGSKITLNLVTGPTPVDVFKQLRNNDVWVPIPYWVLGVHVCRDGDVSNVNKILKEFNSFDDNFPHDSDCIHENLFSLSKNKGNTDIDVAVAKLKTKKKFVMSISPQVLVDNNAESNYKKAEELKILYTKDQKILKGKYLNETVAYPDYSSAKSQQWFKDMYDTELTHLDPDGLVLRNAWPVNDDYEMDDRWRFQYMPKTIMQALSKTLPWDSTSSTSSQHIDVHNSYGRTFTNVVSSQTKSPFILSSTFSEGSHYNAHVQNMNISWVNFKEMIRKTLSHSIFGGQLFSVPVCGDTKQFSKEVNQGLCLRWYLTAATMPLFRISSEMPRRDPTVYNDILHIKKIMLEAIKIRYSLLPYYYTTLSENLPMVRPMFFNFPGNNDTFSLDEQYMIGDALLVAQPSLFPAPNMRVYLPKIPGGWYEFWGGMKFSQTQWVTMPMVESDLVVFVAAGNVVPLQDDTGNTAEETQKKPLGLIIALNCPTKEEKETCNAEGTMFFQNSVTVEFQADANNLIILNAENCLTGIIPDFTLGKLEVYHHDYRHTVTQKIKLCVKKDSRIQLDNILKPSN